LTATTQSGTLGSRIPEKRNPRGDPDGPPPIPNWQPIGFLLKLAAIIDAMLDRAEDVSGSLQPAPQRPYVMDDDSDLELAIGGLSGRRRR
jgi:hypothetical protein